eukprot:3195626-Pyramimonas_sp.AAC.1
MTWSAWCASAAPAEATLRDEATSAKARVSLRGEEVSANVLITLRVFGIRATNDGHVFGIGDR